MENPAAENYQVPADAYLRLKSGVRVVEVPATRHEASKLFVGTSRGGVLFSEVGLRPFLNHLDGSRTLGDFLADQIFSPVEIQQAANELLQANLLIVESEKFSHVKNFDSESHRISEMRLAHEAGLASWISATPEDGRDRVRARINFSILIFGTSRLATALFSILQASGFSQVKLLSGERSLLTTSGKRENSSRVKIDELCGLNILLSDIGKNRDETISRITQSAQLFPKATSNFPRIPDLVISTESVQPDYIQRWMSEGVAHLQISHLSESFIEVGPLVIPGKTACLRCVAMRKFALHKIPALVELLGSLDSAPELSSAGSAFLAGFAAGVAIQYADTGYSPLMEKSLRFNLIDISNPEHIYWEPHIFCGCLKVI